MLVITIELHSAIDGHREVLGQALIYNDGKGTAERGDYDGEILRKGSPISRERRITRTGRVTNYPRLRKPVWALLAQMLNNMGYG